MTFIEPKDLYEPYHERTEYDPPLYRPFNIAFLPI
jgi:hypothetical protein